MERCSQPCCNEELPDEADTPGMVMAATKRIVGDISQLVGLTMANVQRRTPDEVQFTTTDGRVFRLYHEDECCEHVVIESIDGDLSDLIGVPMSMAEEATNSGSRGDDTSFTWTFYRLAGKGYVTIRWYGESNGYYSETATFAEFLAE